jgi:hypothetical protein
MFLKIILLLILIGVLFWGLKNLESRALYFPHKTLEADPSVYGLKFENVFFETTDHLKLNGWFIPAGERRRRSFLPRERWKYQPTDGEDLLFP